MELAKCKWTVAEEGTCSMLVVKNAETEERVAVVLDITTAQAIAGLPDLVRQRDQLRKDKQELEKKLAETQGALEEVRRNLSRLPGRFP